MIAIKSTECINQAVAYELQNIVKKYGAIYNSEHEGYAVLLEEVEEADSEMIFVKGILEKFWESIKCNNVNKELLYYVKQHALSLAEEAVQVAAVCERFEETIANKSEPPTYREDKTIL